ncbi:MAG: CHAD domain-containing protein, partial [Rhodospirillales bacterium]|nr:CHAD domain-containing protein [Rhodospirillales bacterium]
ELGRPLPSPIAARAWLEGARLLAEAGAVRVALLDARLRDADGERARAWLTLSGPADAVTALADELAGAAPVRVPCAVPAAEALAGTAGPRPRGAGAPVLPVALGVGTAFAEVVGQLTASLLAEAPAIPAAMGVDSEPVHRMRVALRRLRAVMSLFGHAVACPALAEARLALKALAAALGPARDWDVFLAGTGRQVGAAFGGEPAVARLLAAAGRQRHAAYAARGAELENAEFRRLGVALACLAAARPWERTAPTDPDAAARRDRLLAQPLEAFAARTLRRRARHLREIGPDLSGLPDAALHAIRLQAKRLRYACEVFAPLYPGRRARRMIRRLAALQDRLGLLNDASVAAGLMASLGAAGHGHAAGIVRGYVAGAAAGARTDAQRAWRRLHRLEPFWE